MNENEKKYDDGSTSTFSVDEIMAEVLSVKAKPRADDTAEIDHVFNTDEKPPIPKKDEKAPAANEERDKPHELWISVTPENADNSDKFATDEYEPERFEALAVQEAQTKTRITLNDIPDSNQGTRQFKMIDIDKINENPPPAEESAAEDSPAEESAEVDSYLAAEGEKALREKLRLDGAAHGMRLAASVIIGGALSYLGLAVTQGLPLFTVLDGNHQYIAIAAIILTALLIAAYIMPFLRGIANIFAGKPNSDSAAAFSALVALALPTVSMAFPAMQEKLHIFGGSAALALALTSIGGILETGRKRIALDRITEKGEKRALLPIGSVKTCKDLLGGMSTIGHDVYKPVRTEEVSGFEAATESRSPSDMSIRILVIIALAGGLLLGAGSYFFGRDIPAAISAAACFIMAMTPLTAPLISSLPMFRMAHHLRYFGSAVMGYDAVTEMTQIGSVIVDSTYLFPKSTVTLHGIRTFGSFRIDDAIIDAASVVCASNGALAGVFLGVIDNNRSILRHVDAIVYEDGLGLSAWVSERRVLVGTAELLRNHNIDVPSRDYEARYRRDGRDLVYVSVAGELTAMFVVSYAPRREIAEEVKLLRHHKVGLIVLNRDCNITEDMIASRYDFPRKMIKILPATSERALGKPVYDICPAPVVYSKGIMGLAESVVCSLRMNTTVNITNVLQTGGSILGGLLVIYLAAVGGLNSFGLTELLLWQGIWGMLTLLLSLFRHP